MKRVTSWMTTLVLVLSVFLISPSSTATVNASADSKPKVVDFIVAEYENYKESFVDQVIDSQVVNGTTIEKHEISLPEKNIATYYWYAKSNESPKDSGKLILDIHGWGTTELSPLPENYVSRGYTYFGMVWWPITSNEKLTYFSDDEKYDLLINAALMAMYVKDVMKIKEPVLYNQSYAVIGNSYGGVIGSIIAQIDIQVDRMMLFCSTGGISNMVGETRLFDLSDVKSENVEKLDPDKILTRDIPIYSYFSTNDMFFSVDDAWNYLHNRPNTRVYLVPNKNHDLTGVSNTYADTFLKGGTNNNIVSKKSPKLDYNNVTTRKNSNNTFIRFYSTVKWDGVKVDKVYFSNGEPLLFSHWKDADFKNGEYSIFDYTGYALNVIVEGSELDTGLKVSYLIENYKFK